MKWLSSKMLRSLIYCRKPMSEPMSEAASNTNGQNYSIRARVEHVFAHQKKWCGLFIRTIGLARAQAKLTLANSAFYMDRLVFHERRAAIGRARRNDQKLPGWRLKWSFKPSGQSFDGCTSPNSPAAVGKRDG